MLEVKSIAVDHGPLRAVWDLSFKVDQGERYGLLGTNGAGQSTTVGALMGLYKVKKGKIIYRGEDITSMRTAERVARGIAMVPEGRRLFNEMTVRENLLMGAYSPVLRQKIPKTLEKVLHNIPILKDRISQRAGELSGGQQQQLTIGRALMSRPKLLLLDEPFMGVAPLVIEEIKKILGEVSASGVILILVEQNVHRAMEIVNRAAVIENGRLVSEGTKEALLSDAEFGSKYLGID